MKDRSQEFAERTVRTFIFLAINKVMEFLFVVLDTSVRLPTLWRIIVFVHTFLRAASPQSLVTGYRNPAIGLSLAIGVGTRMEAR